MELVHFLHVEVVEAQTANLLSILFSDQRIALILGLGVLFLSSACDLLKSLF